MKRSISFISLLFFIIAGMVLGYSKCPQPSLNFTGTYLVTVAYGNGEVKLGKLLIAQNNNKKVTAELIYPDTGDILSGKGSVNGNQISFELSGDTSVIPSAVPGKVTNISFTGIGIDSNQDMKVDSLNGDFNGQECTPTCNNVEGQFDAALDKTAEKPYLNFTGKYDVKFVIDQDGSEVKGKIDIAQQKDNTVEVTFYVDGYPPIVGKGSVKGDYIEFGMSYASQQGSLEIKAEGTGSDTTGDYYIDNITGNFKGFVCNSLVCLPVSGKWKASRIVGTPAPLNFEGSYAITMDYDNMDRPPVQGKLGIAQYNDGSVEVKLYLSGNQEPFLGKGRISGDQIGFTVYYSPTTDTQVAYSYTFTGTGIDQDKDGYVDIIKGTFSGSECGGPCYKVSGTFYAVREIPIPQTLNFSGEYNLVLYFEDGRVIKGILGIAQEKDNSLQAKVYLPETEEVFLGKGNAYEKGITFTVYPTDATTTTTIPPSFGLAFKGTGYDKNGDLIAEGISGAFQGICIENVCVDLYIGGKFSAEKVENPTSSFDFTGKYKIFLKGTNGNLEQGLLELAQSGNNVKAVLILENRDYRMTGTGTVNGVFIDFQVSYQSPGDLSESYTFSGKGSDKNKDKFIDLIEGTYEGYLCGFICNELAGTFQAKRGDDIPVALNFAGSYSFTMYYDNVDIPPKVGILEIYQAEDNTIKVQLKSKNSNEVYTGYGAVSKDQIKITVSYNLPEAYISYTYTFTGIGTDENGDNIVEYIKGSFDGTECKEVACFYVCGVWYANRKPVDTKLNFSGKYKLTMYYEDGTQLCGNLNMYQANTGEVSVDIEFIDNGQVLSGNGKADGEKIEFTVYSTPTDTKPVPYSITYTGIGVDNDGDIKIDQIHGKFQGNKGCDLCPVYTFSGKFVASRIIE